MSPVPATSKLTATEKTRKWRATFPDRAKALRQRLYPRDRETVLARSQEWREANQERYRALLWKAKLRRVYGITPEQYDAILEGQGNACASCGSDTPGGHGKWNLDHCHDTGDVRGILCHGCNLGLGLLKDVPTTFGTSLVYLGAHGKLMTP